MSRNFFLFTTDLLTPELFFELCIYKTLDIYKTLKGIGKIQFVSELTKSSQRKLKLKLSKLECYSICGKANLGVIRPIHITIYSF